MELTAGIDPEVFISSYWLKEELVSFCRSEGLPTSGSKMELTERIHRYLSDGTVIKHTQVRRKCESCPISLDSPLGEGFVCSQDKREFFEEHIGRGFRFSGPFQQWLRTHPEATYADAIREYPNAKGDGSIPPQFEYNTYVREFFADNPGRTLEDAVKCWNHRKSQQGAHRYSREDLQVLETDSPQVRGDIIQ